MENKKEALAAAIAAAVSPDNIQKYILGTKKNGQPRAVYDIVRDFTTKKDSKKKKKKKKKDGKSNYDLYVGLRKKSKKKNKKKYWNIYGE